MAEPQARPRQHRTGLTREAEDRASRVVCLDCGAVVKNRHGAQEAGGIGGTCEHPAEPSWLAAWTSGSWVKVGMEERNEGHRRWFATLSAPCRELLLNWPPGSVVELRWDCLPRSVEPGALALWTTRHGIVIGYLDPTEELQALGVPPDGALVLLESPDPSAAAQGVVFAREVDRVVGHLQGYDSAAARANLLGEAPPPPPAVELVVYGGGDPDNPRVVERVVDRGMTETPVSVAGAGAS